MAFAYDLGSADPCSTAVHMEPFSTSVFRGLVGIFATTTEICTRGGSSRARARTFDAHRGDPPTRRSVDERKNSLPRRPGIGSSLQRHPFSGLVDSAGELLHTPSGFQLPWPPPCCLDRPTPFVVSDERLRKSVSGALARRLVHPTAPVLLTKSGPLGTRALKATGSIEKPRASHPFEV